MAVQWKAEATCESCGKTTDVVMQMKGFGSTAGGSGALFGLGGTRHEPVFDVYTVPGWRFAGERALDIVCSEECEKKVNAKEKADAEARAAQRAVAAAAKVTT